MDEDNKKLVKNCLTVLDLFFSDDKVKIDTANFNPARICNYTGQKRRREQIRRRTAPDEPYYS